MPLVIPQGYAQLSFRYSLSGDQEVMLHTIGLKSVSATFLGMSQAVSEVNDEWVTNMIEPDGDTMLTSYTYLGVRARANTSDGGELEIEDPESIAGNMVGAAPTQNVALLVQKRSTLGGRRNRGRMYTPPAFVSEGSINADGSIDGTQLALINTRLDGFRAAIAVSSVVDELVILHNDTPAPPPAPTAISTLTFDTRVATQRRRLRR